MSELGLLDIVKNPKQDIVDGPFGSNMKSSDYKDSGVPVIKLQNIKVNCFLEKNISFVTPKKANELTRHNYQPGDIVITKLGDPLGVACIMPDNFPKGIIVADLIRLRPDYSKVDPKFLCYQLNSPLIANQFKELTKGTTRPRVNLTLVRQITVWIPNIVEQRKVTAKIDALFLDIDSSCELLKNAKNKLAIFKQSILNSAIHGKLISQNSTDEPASVLLEKIINEKNALIRAGKLKKEKPLSQIHQDEAPFELPKGWVWARLGDIAIIGTGATPLKGKNAYYEGGTIPWITSAATNNDFIENANAYITKQALEDTNCKLFDVGTLILAMYGEGKTRGQISELKIEAATNQAVASISLLPSAKGLKELVRASFKERYESIRNQASGAVQPNLNLSIVKEQLIALPPLTEVSRIEIVLSSLLADAHALRQEIDEKISFVHRLKQSILKKAFEDQLI